ncbi:hypothetical protein LguiB_007444 [Lonicera macranthoides]
MHLGLNVGEEDTISSSSSPNRQNKICIVVFREPIFRLMQDKTVSCPGNLQNKIHSMHIRRIAKFKALIRCTILTFIAVEPSGHCRIVAVPVEYSDNTIPLGSGSGGVNKEHLVSPSPVSPLQADRQHRARRGPAANRNYFVKPVTGRSNSQHQSQKEDIGNKEDKAVKRNSRKKPKKKGKRNKKLSTSEADANKNFDNKVDASESLVTSVLRLSSSESGHVILDGEVQDTHCKPIGSCDYQSSSIHSELHDSSGLLDSASLVSNSNNSFNADEEGIDLSKLSGNMLHDALYSNSQSEKRHSGVPEKREKQIKRSPKNSSVYRVSNAGNLHGRFGKENSHSVWQKVQRNDADECNNSSTKSNVADSGLLSNSEDKSQTKLKVTGKMKGKTSSGLKQEGNYYSRKESNAIRTHSNLGLRNNMKQSGLLDTPAQTSGQKEVDAVSKSDSKNGFQTKKVESVAFRPFHNSQVCPNELGRESVYATSSSNDQNADNQLSFVSLSCNSMDPSELLEELPVVQPHRLVDESKVIKQISSTEQTRQESTSGNLMQKWVPVGVKDCESQNYASSADTRAMCRGESSENVTRSASKEAEIVCIHNENSSNLETEEHKISTAENDLSKMGSALNDVKRAEWASEAVSMATGCPIAEFERILQSASPVICPSSSIVSCQTCLPDQVLGASLCRHETPGICLRNVWEWYEKHGNYGLEVKADDYENSKRLGMDSVAFRAYFIPLLSAVQLFRKCKGNHTKKGDEVSTEAMESSDMYRKSETSTSKGHLPTFPVLVPQPRGEDDLELLFEYFEPEQPQKRQPLFETIKELVKGDGYSQCGAYGDPTALQSLGLNDLHPKSWFSVAWYPIYRIPDGNFRAAFLTYHSLGHLVRRSSTFHSLCEDVSIVSPVVGLQSYNAQGECWFRPRYSETAVASNLNLAGVLQDRLRTLEHTASLMARATVTKGSETYMNRQPDYEFFLSRRR